MDFIPNLIDRNMLYDIIPGTQDQLQKEMTLGYVGFDATAPSLHIGNLGAIMMLVLFQKCGHKPIALVGGATTMVGDPGGKTSERKLMTKEEIYFNQNAIKCQLEKFINFSNVSNSAEIVNNYDWINEFSYIDFLRDVGKYIPVSYMMSKDSVKNRLETGISYAEFSYQLLQGYDFYHLYKEKNVKIQMGGSDQWGNLTTGTELIRRKLNQSAYAITTPLITKPDGTKFGKTEAGAIWLDPKMTSPYKFFQYWINTTDEMAVKLYNIFSLNKNEIRQQLIKSHIEKPHLRILQKELAKELTTRIHSSHDFEQVSTASEILFSKDFIEKIEKLENSLIYDIFEGVPKIEIQRQNLENIDIFEFLSQTTNGQIFSSKSEIRRTLQSGSLYINRKKIDQDYNMKNTKIIKNKFIFIQKGKKKYYMIILK